MEPARIAAGNGEGPPERDPAGALANLQQPAGELIPGPGNGPEFEIFPIVPFLFTMQKVIYYDNLI
jgi:hypothetical protein